MQLTADYYDNEVREGFFIPGMTKRCWAAQMDILEWIADICKKNSLKWFADGGTLLGAARHKGFIPWDDDLDICMFRDDYDRFFEIATAELPSNYKVENSTNEPTCGHFWTKIKATPLNVSRDHFEAPHDFPYVAGVDIFPLDHIAPDAHQEEAHQIKVLHLFSLIFELEKNAEEPEQKKSDDEIIAEAEALCHVNVNRDLPLKTALLQIIDCVFREYNNQKSDQVSIMFFWLPDRNFKYSISWFDHTVKLPFETTEVNAPAAYEEVLNIEYGSWKTPVRQGGAHDYPYYKIQEQLLADEHQGNIPYQYSFSPDDLKNDERPVNARKKNANTILFQILSTSHDLIRQTLAEKKHAVALELCKKCQELAIQIGTSIEKEHGSECATVRLLEQYCDLVYQLHEAIAVGDCQVSKLSQQLNEQLQTVQTSYAINIRQRKTILFFPFKSSCWNTMQSLYEVALSDTNSDVYVIPIPYYEKKLYGSIGMEHFDIEKYPNNLPILDYREFDYMNRHPDVMVIQNPYDEYGSASSVHPFFYARNLKQYTGKLVYLPYFTLDEIDPEDKKSLINAPCYAVSPGVVHSDKVIVQSENMKKIYINALTKAAGKSTRNIWENKICTELTL